MSPPQWHLKFALQMVDLADRERNKGNAWIASHAILRAFEEIIDAYGAEEGLHFHDAYPIEAWRERIRWMRDFKPDLQKEWNDLTGLCMQIPITGQIDHGIIFQMLAIVRTRLNMIEDRQDSSSE